jgi:hypothetical protein
MTRCDYCGGRLGLIVHRSWWQRFCKRACKTAFERRRRERIRCWCVAFLSSFGGLLSRRADPARIDP